MDESFDCALCKDKGFTFGVDEKGYEIAYECSCRQQKVIAQRFKNAMIPSEFEDARFDNFRKDEPYHQEMSSLIGTYLRNFDTPKRRKDPEKPNKALIFGESLGLISVFGEQRIRSLQPKEKARAKMDHNNFGIGKTHLQVAAAKWLMKNGYSTLVVSDAQFLDELIQTKLMGDNGEKFNGLMHTAATVDVLIWDDMGKAKPSEAKENLYYRIINDRYLKKLPILFSSNEDQGTLPDRIGYAASSRLFGMAKNYLLAVEGEDQRAKGE